MLIDAKDRHYLITLREGAEFHTHAGIVRHDDVIGALEGSLIRGSTERSFLVLRPTLSDVVLKMPRGAQVIYPKDLGTILIQADVGPGMRVLEAGVGSGALSMTLLRAGALITGYEIREDFALQATKNVHDMLGTDVAYDVQIRDVTMGIDETDLDRIILDMPEPWDVVKHAEVALRPGESSWPISRRSIRRSSCVRPFATTPSDSKRRSRYFGERGTSTGVRFARTIGWSRTRLHHERAAAREARRGDLIVLDEDALTGALFGGFGDRVFRAGWHHGDSFGAARGALHVGALFHVGQAVVEQGEHVGTDLFAETVAGAQVLVNPNLHLGALRGAMCLVTLAARVD